MPPVVLSSVCIIGAGAAGLAAAHALTEAGVACTVIDKSRGVSGRAATRWRDVERGGTTHRWRVDHGAQVFNPEPGSPADRLVRKVAAHALVSIEAPTVPFDDDGTVRPDRIRDDAAPRLAFRDGYATLGRALAGATPALDLHLRTTAMRLDRQDGAWFVDTTPPDGDARLGPFRAVVLTPPAPQAAALVRASNVEADARLGAALGGATYRSQWTVVLGFAESVALPHGAYALVNAPDDGATEARTPHDVAWLALESAKPNRAPRGASLLVAQMSPGWTEAHYDADRAAIVAQARQRIEALAGPLPEPLWTDTQRWRYSLPDSAVDTEALRAAEGLGLFAAGDAVAGKGRVHLALESGLSVARRVTEALGTEALR